MNFQLFLNIKLQISKVQMQTLQTQKTPVSTVYSNVTARIDTVNEQNNKMKNGNIHKYLLEDLTCRILD